MELDISLSNLGHDVQVGAHNPECWGVSKVKWFVNFLGIFHYEAGMYAAKMWFSVSKALSAVNCKLYSVCI